MKGCAPLDKVLFFGGFFAGTAHGYCHARNITLLPAIHSMLTYGGTVVTGAVHFSVGAMAGKEFGFFQSLQNGAIGAATGALIGATSTLAGYGIGYGVGRFL
jgi:hypothetical protein